MVYPAEAIAGSIINWSHKLDLKITNFRLSKLLYFVQAEYIRRFGSRLIDEDFVCWQYGPAIPSVYYKYCVAASLPLPKQPLTIEIEDQAQVCILYVLARSAEMKMFDLVGISQSQDPWKYNTLIFGKGSNIPYKCMEEFFLCSKDVFAI